MELLFNLAKALLFTGYLLRFVRRFERRADAVLAEMDAVQEQELRKYNRIGKVTRIQFDSAFEVMQP